MISINSYQRLTIRVVNSQRLFCSLNIEIVKCYAKVKVTKMFFTKA